MKPILSFVNLFLGATIFAIPSMTRRGILFAVPVPPDLRESPKGRQSIAIFRVVVAGVTLAGLCALLFSPEPIARRVAVAEPFVILAAGGLAFAWQHRRMRPFAVQPRQARTAELTGTPDRLPWFFWLGAGPLAFLTMAAAFLHSNWDQIPARFPVHWGVDGQPNRWSIRSPHGVYGPLLFAAGLCVWILILGLAGWFGSRRSRFRRMIIGIMIAADYMIGLLFGMIAIKPLVNIPMWIPLVGPVLFVVAMMIVMAREIGEPGDAVEATPNECWKGGVIYYNPDDAALMVEKRAGLGYTFNFGNRWSWVLLAGTLLVAASAFLLV